MNPKQYDVIIIGTGAGGGTLAYKLAGSGKKILILERGDFLVRSKDNWDPAKVFGKEIYHTQERWLTREGKPFRPGQAYMVGGQTKVYGAALLRLRKEDFGEIHYKDGISPSWPVGYDDLEPYYNEAEKLYFVHGEKGEDPTEPPRGAYPYPKLSHEPRIQEIFGELQAQGHKPFHLPIGIKRFEDNLRESPCIRCETCDGFPCAVNAKGDSEISCLTHALAHPNVTLLTRALVERLETDESGKKIQSVKVLREGETLEFSASLFILSAGAVNSAALLLRSRDSKNPEGLANSSGLVGRNYMCHNNSAMLAIHPVKKNPTLFQKTIGVNDYYFGAEDAPIGHIQLLGKATEGLLKADKPEAPRFILKWMADHSVDWWFTTEDLPHPENRVTLTEDGNIKLSYTPSNREPHFKLIKAFKKTLWNLGFRVLLEKTMPINAVAHQVGTTVFGKDPRKSVLDPWCRAHDHENLFVVDGGFFPSSSAVNPSLTIAAQALRVGEHIRKHVLAEQMAAAR